MIEHEILVDSIRTGKRRRELGDVEALAKSIADIGLIFPIAVGRDMQLVLGPRRLAAVKLLGWPTVPAVSVSDLDSVIERMRVERDDDTESKPMLRSEMVSMGLMLEWVDLPARQERRTRASRAGGMRTTKGGRARPHSAERIAAALGVGTPTYSRAKHVVVMATSHPDPAVRAVACEQVKLMDRTDNINGPYNRVRALTRTKDWLSTTASPPLTGAATQRKAFGAALLALRGVTDGLTRIPDIDERITTDEAAQWVDGLAESRRVIERTINRLRQHSAKGKAT